MSIQIVEDAVSTFNNPTDSNTLVHEVQKVVSLLRLSSRRLNVSEAGTVLFSQNLVEFIDIRDVRFGNFPQLIARHLALFGSVLTVESSESFLQPSQLLSCLVVFGTGCRAQTKELGKVFEGDHGCSRFEVDRHCCLKKGIVNHVTAIP